MRATFLLLLSLGAFSSAAAQELPPAPRPEPGAKRKKGTPPGAAGAAGKAPGRTTESIRATVSSAINTWRRGNLKLNSGLLYDLMEETSAAAIALLDSGRKTEAVRFYAKTIQDLNAVYGKAGLQTPGGAEGLQRLLRGLKKASVGETVERQAWALRYAFDRAKLSHQVRLARSKAILELGHRYRALGKSALAIECFVEATNSLDELRGPMNHHMPNHVLLAPLVLAHAYVSAQNFKQAARMVDLAFQLAPGLVRMRIDRPSFHGSEEQYLRLVAVMEASATAAPEDGALQVLLGYEYWTQNKLAGAKEHLTSALKLYPQLLGIRRLLAAIDAGISPGKAAPKRARGKKPAAKGSAPVPLPGG